jgi:hypothetical protein
VTNSLINAGEPGPGLNAMREAGVEVVEA